MFPNVTVGQFVPGTSPVHRLDARTKILATLVYLVLLLAGRGWGAVGACAAFTVVSLAGAGLPAGPVWRGLRPILLLVLATAVLDVLLTPGLAAWRFGPLVVSGKGLHVGLTAGIRLTLLVLQSSALTITTDPLDLSAGAERLLRPFRRVGVPAHELALMSSIALRFIPTLADEAERIRLAQAARGADFDAPGRARLRASLALLVPLLISVFRRAEELALAMEARGYRGEEGRTRWRQSRAGRADFVAATVVAALSGWVAWTTLGGRLL